MSRSVSLLATMALVLLLGSSDAFQIAAPRASTPLQNNNHLSSTLFVAPRPTTTIGMSYNGAEPNNNNTMESGLKLRIRNLLAAIWRFLTLPMRLFRNNSDNDEAPYIDATALQEGPTSSNTVWEESTSYAPEPVIVDKRLSPITAIQPRNNRAPRWAVATSDFSGHWILMATDNFMAEYEEYLNNLMGPLPQVPGAREADMGYVSQTEEIYEQTEEGRVLTIRGNDGWDRSLVASGVDGKTDSFQPAITTVIVDYGEPVEAEAWWEDGGTSHISWMRGLTNYGGGDFESKRYLESAGKVLVCESVFIPDDISRVQAKVTWRFIRNGETL